MSKNDNSRRIQAAPKKKQSFNTAVTFYFFPNRALVYGNPYYFFIIYRLQKEKILLEIQKRENRQMICKSRAFRMYCISKIIKDRTFFLFAIDSQ